MEHLFFGLLITSLFLLILGLFSPKTSLFWIKTNQTRGKSSLIYGLTMILFLVAFGETANKKKEELKSSSAIESIGEKVFIDLHAVDSVIIKRRQVIDHTIVHKPIKLTESNQKVIIDKWNKSTGRGLCKFLPVFEMTVYLTDKRTRNFRINAQSIKEDKDWCYDLGDPDFIEKLLMSAE